MSDSLRIENLSESLWRIEAEIAAICKAHSVPMADLEESVDLFAEAVQDELLGLLELKLELQMDLFKIQGGNLKNVEFLPISSKRNG